MLPGEWVLLWNFRCRSVSVTFLDPLPFCSVITSLAFPSRNIQPEGKQGPIQTAHRNNAKSCPANLRDEHPELEVNPHPKDLANVGLSWFPVTSVVNPGPAVTDPGISEQTAAQESILGNIGS